MITKEECYRHLLKMRKDGENVEKYIKTLSNQSYVSDEVIQFINEKRDLDITVFYEVLREKNNKKHSKLYKELLSEDLNHDSILKTLSSFITNGLINANKLPEERRELFYKQIRLDACSEALLKYFRDSDISMVIKVLKDIKSDIKLLKVRGENNGTEEKNKKNTEKIE